MKKGKLTTIADYVAEPQLTPTQRIGHFLNWAAIVMAHRYFTAAQLAKVAYNLRSVPATSNKDVQTVKKRMQAVKRVLMGEYRRVLYWERGHGYRASVNDEDASRHELVRQKRRLESTIRGAEKVRSVIEVKNISDKAVRESVRQFDQNLKLMTSPEFIKRLQLPEAKRDAEAED